MEKSLLDDISFEDIEKQYKKVEESSCREHRSRDVLCHIIQVYYEIPKGKDVLMFALVNFGGYECYDIRRWYDNGTKPGKGMSFTEKEIMQLKEDLERFNPSNLSMQMIAEFYGGKAHARIYDRICLISSYKEKDVEWNKEATVIDWNYGAKVDLRKWSDGYEHCGKGISLSFEEIQHIGNVLKELFD